MTEEIRSVVVLGAGTMGSQIAAVSALAGYTTSLVDIQQKQLDRARELGADAVYTPEQAVEIYGLRP